MHVYEHVYDVYAHADAHVYTHVYAHACTQVYTHVCTHACACFYTHVYIHVRTRRPGARDAAHCLVC